ncbi:MAG: helix-turn-helix transcriptional regulator [Kiritimatiellae bacterium]|nr:helix-turn-helix transcriptional regulator [Kiritimatiellia bacterium]
MERQESKNAIFRQRLREYRPKVYRAAEAFAQAIGEKPGTVAAWEKKSGTAAPQLHKVAAICRALDVSADYLLGLIDEPLPYVRAESRSGVFHSLRRHSGGADGGDVIAHAEGASSHASNTFLPPAGNPDCRNCQTLALLAATLKSLSDGRRGR